MTYDRRPRRHFAAWIGFGWVLALAACGEPPSGGWAQTRLALDPEVLPAADTVVLEVHTPAGLESRHPFSPPWPTDVWLPVSPGAGRSVVLDATAGGIPYARGRAELADLAAGDEVEAEVVVDLVGVLEVVPLGIAEVLGVVADPQAPFEGQPRLVPLARDAAGRFSAVLPAGRYDLSFGLPDAFLTWVPAAPPEAEVVAGVVRRWQEPLVDPGLPLPEPGVAVRLEVEVAGNTLPVRLPPVRIDVTVRALDAEGRLATGYRGTVQFAWDAVAGLTPTPLPAPYAFTEADAGTHTFAEGLEAPLLLVGDLVGLRVSDETGLTTRVDLRLARR